MKFVIDDTIAFVKGVFEPYADVVYKAGADIRNADVLDADALIIRTRTRCDAALLDGSSVKIIAMASIGMHNIDIEYCEAHGIFVQNATGCNAGGVMNYVFSALYGTAARKTISLSGATMGIIGLGNSGRRVAKMARYLGFKVLQYDPPKAEVEGPDAYCTLDELLADSDIITLHIPLTDATRNMCDASFFAKMSPGTFFINSSRGELVDENALMEAIPRLGPVIIDAWRNEPDINADLLEMVDIATPHIAGYSYQGKQTAALTVVRAVARYFSISQLYDFFPPTDIKELEAIRLDLKDKSQGEIASMLQYNYPIFTDDFMLRMNPADFEYLRHNYSYRREFYVDY